MLKQTTKATVLPKSRKETDAGLPWQLQARRVQPVFSQEREIIFLEQLKNNPSNQKPLR
jgi:hypothetical protein